ncbi:MAG: VOC family protein [Vicinamibacterales bacterium]
MRGRTWTAMALAAVIATSFGEHAEGQGLPPLAHARLTHVALATEDADKTVARLAAILGIVPPSAHTNSLEAPGGGTIALKVAFLDTANCRIEVDQPLGPGPTRDFLNRFGPGIQHVGFSIDEPLDSRVRSMERLGGRLVAGSATGRYAFLDFMATLGVTIELVRDMPGEAAGTAPGPTSLASHALSHIGFVYRDAQPKADALARLLGLTAPALNVFTSIDYLLGTKAAPGSHVKYVMLPVPNVSVEVIEPVGAPSPWADFIDGRKDGAAAHHLAFGFGPLDDFDGAVRALHAQGGVWKKGRRGFEGTSTGSSPEFEFLDTLGIVIEVTRSAR